MLSTLTLSPNPNPDRTPNPNPNPNPNPDQGGRHAEHAPARHDRGRLSRLRPQAGKLMRTRTFLSFAAQSWLQLAWASPEVGLESSYTPRRGSNPAPGCTLPRVGVDVVLVNTAPW